MGSYNRKQMAILRDKNLTDSAVAIELNKKESQIYGKRWRMGLKNKRKGLRNKVSKTEQPNLIMFTKVIVGNIQFDVSVIDMKIDLTNKTLIINTK
tara:strand:+ start:162 stop:449 length:288 start_codon:yes stop_codon:yes gene_type:complete